MLLMWCYFITDSEFPCSAKVAKPYFVSGPTYMPQIPNLLHCIPNCAVEVLIIVIDFTKGWMSETIRWGMLRERPQKIRRLLLRLIEQPLFEVILLEAGERVLPNANPSKPLTEHLCLTHVQQW